MGNEDNPLGEENTHFCDRCGKSPKYISVYEDDDYEEEVFLCKECYKENDKN